MVFLCPCLCWHCEGEIAPLCATDIPKNVFLSVRTQYEVSTITWLLFVSKQYFHFCIKHFTQRAEVLQVLDRLNVIFPSSIDGLEVLGEALLLQ